MLDAPWLAVDLAVGPLLLRRQKPVARAADVACELSHSCFRNSQEGDRNPSRIPCQADMRLLSPDRDGTVLDAPPLAEDIAGDPLLRRLKLIAWAADDRLLPRGGERGFPHWAVWLERNKRFATDACACLGRAEPATASALATRCAQSRDRPKRLLVLLRPSSCIIHTPLCFMESTHDKEGVSLSSCPTRSILCCTASAREQECGPYPALRAACFTN